MWSRPEQAGEVATPQVLRAVEESLGRHRVLAIEYRSGDGTVSRRRIEPVLLARTGGHWYVAAWCQWREAVRWFRLARILRADLTPERYEPRPAGGRGRAATGRAPGVVATVGLSLWVRGFRRTIARPTHDLDPVRETRGTGARDALP